MSDKILCITDVLENLMPFLLMSVVTQEDILLNIEKDMAIKMRSELLELCSHLTNPAKFYKSDYNVGMILYEFDKYIAKNPNVCWSEMEWVLDMMYFFFY
jgi:hypothetical protein